MDIIELGYYVKIDNHKKELNEIMDRVISEVEYAKENGYGGASVTLPTKYKDGSLISASDINYIKNKLSVLYSAE